MNNVLVSSYRHYCAAVCSQKLVSFEDYQACVDWYLSIAINGGSSARKINYRWMHLVRSKFLRTSLKAGNTNYYPRSAFMALKSHNRIVSRHTASPQDTKSGGGRSSTHRLGRYNDPFQGEFFKRLTSVKTVRALVSSYLTGSPLNTDEVVHNVRP